MNYADCSTQTKDKIITLRENKTKLTINNPSALILTKVKVDGCLIGNQSKKCDWIVHTNKSDKKDNVALFVELKGCRVDDAIEQLAQTLILTKSKFSDHKKICYAITTRVPKTGPSISRGQQDFKKLGATLIVKNTPHEVPIS